MSKEPSGPWIEPMRRAKATDPRNGVPSWTRLADLTGLSTSTITAMISGNRVTSTETIQKVADALNQDAQTIRKWLGLDRQAQKPYEPPPEADLLSDRQRKALTALIRSIVTDDEKADTAQSADEKTGDGMGRTAKTSISGTARATRTPERRQ